MRTRTLVCFTCFFSFLFVVLRNYLLKFYPAQLSLNKMFIYTPQHTIQTVLKMIFIVFHQIQQNTNIIFFYFILFQSSSDFHTQMDPNGMRHFVFGLFIFSVQGLSLCFILRCILQI